MKRKPRTRKQIEQSRLAWQIHEIHCIVSKLNGLTLSGVDKMKIYYILDQHESAVETQLKKIK